ncbi:MAG: DUF6263 family protein [Prevotellaceae bacterium]|jgi:hypothetical protein|nr:DUF6263 family protein [Prevotellaceae bacterium]
MKKISFLLIAAIFAINCFAAKPQPQPLRFNLQNGQTFTHDVNLNMNLDVSMQGLSMNVDIPILATLKYEVISENSVDTIILKAELDMVKMHVEFMGQKLDFDSDSENNDNDKFSGALKDVLHKPFEIHFDKFRKITDIVGLDSVFKKNVTSNSNSFEFIAPLDTVAVEESDEWSSGEMIIGETKFNLESNTTNTEKSEDNKLSKEDLREIYPWLSMVFFSDEPAKKGLKWNQQLKKTENVATIELNQNYKIKEINQDNVVIECNEKIKMAGNDKDVDINMTANSKGNVVVDNFGWLLSSNLKSVINAIIKLEKMNIPLKITFDLNIISK